MASDEFQAAEQDKDKAKQEISDKSSLEKIWNNIGTAQAHLNKAQAISASNRDHVTGTLQARQAALAAGARGNSASGLKKLDDQFRSNAGSLGKDVTDADTWGTLQQGYLNLELAAIQQTKLGESRSIIQNAIKDHADNRAPRSLAKAQTAMKNAENVIATDRHNDAAVNPAVAQANETAQFAWDVTETANHQPGKIAEGTAIDLVNANRATNSLKNQLASSQGDLKTADQSVAALARERKMDQALEAARRSFSPSEAVAYREGDKLLIRLKQINFSSNRSDLPANSLPLLAKVKEVIKDLNSQAITVEGHTDSVGTKAQNMKLSQARAEAVAKYFQTEMQNAPTVEAVGYGFNKPLTQNKSKAGRAENRRVDVIVTPSATL